MHEMALQTKQAVAEADIVVFIVDGRQGLTPHDKTITDFLRKSGRRVMLVINKSEGMKYTSVTAEFYELGLGEVIPVSAAHGQGVRSMVEFALDQLGLPEEDEDEDEPDTSIIRLAVAGRPNVGKSTLINTWLGEERLVAFDIPGTTRDAITVPFERDGQKFELIDTAGLRRKGKVKEADGGRTIVQELETALNPNGGWYAGADILNANSFEPLSAAEYDWKQAYVPTVWTGLEKLKNQGELAVINLVTDMPSIVAVALLAEMLSVAVAPVEKKVPQ
jgi:GTP-binding protein